MWDPALLFPIFKTEVFPTLVPSQLCWIVTLWVLLGWFWTICPRGKWKAGQLDFGYLLWGLFWFCGVFHVADMSDVRSRSNSTLPWQWAVCGYFQRLLKETQTEYFLRIIVLGQKTHCMLSSPKTHRLRNSRGLVGLYSGREPWRQKLISSEAQSNIIFLLLEREFKNCWYQLPPWCWCLENAVGRARTDVSHWQPLSRLLQGPLENECHFREICPANSRQLIKMGPGCKMKIQVWPLLSLETSKKFKFYLITFRFFVVFFCFHPGPWKSEFCFQNELLWESETIFLDLSFWATFSKPLLCQWYQHLQKETASLALISLVPSAVSLVLVHMLL